jgi:predicted aspartyl protease
VIPVDVYAHHVFVPVRVNGSDTGWFFLDSGAGASVVTKTWADKIGLSSEGAMRAVGAAGVTSLALAKNIVLNLPGVELPMPSVAVLDAAAGLTQLGRNWDGLLGYDVLSRVVVRIDYERKEITLFDPAVFVPGDHAAALPLTFLGNWPLVPARIVLPGREPIETKCFVDSGAGGLMLSTPFTNSNRVLEAVTKTSSSSIYGAGGESKRFTTRITGLQLGPYILQGPVAGFSPDTKEGALASPDIGAIIGGEILERFTVTFDYPHHRILLEPNSRFGDPFLANKSRHD